jgi:CTP:molybdopterin cytidylyltransferase MocA
VVAEVVRHARTAAAESIEYDGIPAPGRSPAAAARPEGHVIHRVRNTLARATFHGKPGHPVVLGADHFVGVLASATGDRGARDYLAHRRVLTVECGDLAGGRDVDRNPGAG